MKPYTRRVPPAAHGALAHAEQFRHLRYWWGGSAQAVKNWRRALGVPQWGTEGSRRLRQASLAQPRHHWADEHLALLDKVSDEELARRSGRTVNAVRVKRSGLGIATELGRRRREHREGNPS